MDIVRRLCAVAALGCELCGAQNLTTIHSFSGTDGWTPNWLTAANGALYGTTSAGGAFAGGVVFELAPPVSSGAAWTETVLYSFDAYASDGFGPTAITRSESGIFYGATAYGPGYDGTIFSLSPPASPGASWTEGVLYAFQRFTADDGYPSSVTVGPTGTLYGTTTQGGNAEGSPTGSGTVYELIPPSTVGGLWTHNILWSFPTRPGDGSNPVGGLVLGRYGSLYGTTAWLPGSSYGGTVFRVWPTSSTGWNELPLYTFQNGRYPTATMIVGPNGEFYGTTENSTAESGICPAGCGTVFELMPPTSPGGTWTEITLYTFAGAPDGANPYGGVILGPNGILYGTTQHGGTSANCNQYGYLGCGTVFQLTPPASGGAWTETVLHSFTHGRDGAYPQAGLVLGKDGVLYGATTEGGASNYGTVFALKP